jgi:hypothetical protein
MEKAGSVSPKKNIDGGEGGFHLFGNFHRIENLMVPMEIDGNNPWSLLFDIREDGKIVIFNPLHSQVNDLAGNSMTLKEVSQAKKSHGKEVDPDKLINGSIIIF